MYLGMLPYIHLSPLLPIHPSKTSLQKESGVRLEMAKSSSAYVLGHVGGKGLITQTYMRPYYLFLRAAW